MSDRQGTVGRSNTIGPIKSTKNASDNIKGKKVADIQMRQNVSHLLGDCMKLFGSSFKDDQKALAIEIESITSQNNILNKRLKQNAEAIKASEAKMPANISPPDRTSPTYTADLAKYNAQLDIEKNIKNEIERRQADNSLVKSKIHANAGKLEAAQSTLDAMTQEERMLIETAPTCKPKIAQG